MSQRRPTFLSLFSGCGGFDLGFLEAGFECLAAFDNDPVAVKTYRRNISDQIACRDLSTPFSLGGVVDRRRRIDVLIAGPPCQGFSTAGRRDPHDPRNALLVRAGEIAAEIRPAVVVVENVTGVISGEQRRHWERLVSLLRVSGYSTTQLKCDASRLGVAQKRRRMLLLAWRTGRQCNPVLRECAEVSLRDALSDLRATQSHSPVCIAAGTNADQIANRIGPNQKLCNVRASARAVHTWQIPEVFGKTNKRERNVLEAIMRLRRRNRQRPVGDADPVLTSDVSRYIGTPSNDVIQKLVGKGYVRRVGRRFDLVHTFNGKYRRLSWDLPAPTVDTRFGDPRYFLHPHENRGFSVREAARIQGFPDTFEFDAKSHEEFRLVGNAVPPPVGRSIAELVREAILRP